MRSAAARPKSSPSFLPPPSGDPAGERPAPKGTYFADVKRTKSILKALTARAGTLMTTDDIFAAIKLKDPTPDQRNTLVCELCRLEELEKVEDGFVGEGPGRRLAWMVPAPPEEER